tara:strand:- start:544 stop:1005 length:462 start_codon:yes stop_codon:yes gene_type:complete
MKIDEIETTSKHIKLLSKDLRKADENEIVAKTGTTDIQKTLLTGFAMTNYCRSFFVDGKIAGVYGVVSSLDDKNIGSPFLLCTPKIKKIKIKFLRECKNRVEEMSDKFPVLFNYIDSRNKLHLTWLKWCGFKIINEKTFNDVLFYGFLKEKKK